MDSFDTKVIDTKDLSEAVEALKRGDVVAFPTETVYGLGASAYDDSAIGKIYSAKGRPSDNPLIVHISSDAMLKELVHPDYLPKPGDTISKLIQSFWPGPLTILFRKSDKVSTRVTAGLDFVAVRMPSHPIAKKLIEESNLPLAAPSANKSGRPSPTLASHVLEDLKGRIPVIVDGGAANVGVESTVVDLNRNPPLILRPGGVTFEQLRQLVPDIQVYEKSVHGTELEKAPPTPGLKYTHYSPTAKVILFEEGDNLKERLSLRLKEEKQANTEFKIAVIQTHKSFQYKEDELNGVQLYRLGDENAPDVIAAGIFKALRDLDRDNVNLVLVEGISEKNEGLAVMNRLRKAASEIVHK